MPKLKKLMTKLMKKPTLIIIVLLIASILLLSVLSCCNLNRKHRLSHKDNQQAPGNEIEASLNDIADKVSIIEGTQYDKGITLHENDNVHNIIMSDGQNLICSFYFPLLIMIAIFCVLQVQRGLLINNDRCFRIFSKVKRQSSPLSQPSDELITESQASNIFNTQQYNDEFPPFQETVEGICSSFNHILFTVSQSADIVKSRAFQVMDDAFELAVGTTQQTCTIEEVSNSATILSDQADKNTDHVSYADKNIENTIANVKSGKEKMLLLLSSIEEVKINSDSSRIAEETIQLLNEILIKALELKETMKSIDETSQEQKAAIAQIAYGMEQISTIVQINEQIANESLASSHELTALAYTLQEELSRFKTL